MRRTTGGSSGSDGRGRPRAGEMDLPWRTAAGVLLKQRNRAASRFGISRARRASWPWAVALRVEHAGAVIAATQRGLRVLETAGAPTYYFPPSDVEVGRLEAVGPTSLCEWKGAATNYALADDCPGPFWRRSVELSRTVCRIRDNCRMVRFPPVGAGVFSR